MAYKQETGTLNASATKQGGKLVDVWRFRSPFSGRAGPSVPELEVRVSLVNRAGSTSPRMSFVAQGSCLPHAFENSDITVLYEDVQTAVRMQHNLFAGVTWEPWLEIEVHGKTSRQEALSSVEGSLSITYRHLQRGTDTATGKTYTVNSNGIAVPFPLSKKAGATDPVKESSPGASPFEVACDKQLDRRPLGSEYSYLPGTPENIAALEAVLVRLEQLRRQMSVFMQQEDVQASLAEIGPRWAVLPLLGEPEATGARPKP